MKLHTRQEIVDGVKGEVRYFIYRGDHYVCGFSESEAKEFYELLKERFEGKKDLDTARPIGCTCKSMATSVVRSGVHFKDCPVIN